MILLLGVLGTVALSAAPMYRITAITNGSLMVTSASDINERGEVTGTAWDGTDFVASLYTGGRMLSLGRFPGDYQSFGESINDRGEVVGHSVGTPNAPSFIAAAK